MAGILRLAAAHPVERAVLQQPQTYFRLGNAHVEDQGFAGQEWRQFGIHGELGDLHQRRSVGLLPYANIMQCHGRKRQKTSVNGAMNGHLLADNPTRLILEILAKIGPVYEERSKQRHEQHYYEYSPQENQDLT